MKLLALFLATVFATECMLAEENNHSIQGVPKLIPIHRHGGTVVRGGIATSGDRHGCELAVETDSGTFVFDWGFAGRFNFKKGETYQFILSEDRRSLQEIRDRDGDVEWKPNTTLPRPEVRLLRIHFADPVLIKG